MTTAILSFATPGQVRLRCDAHAIDETRPLDAAPFAAWAREYAAAQDQSTEDMRSLELERERLRDLGPLGGAVPEEVRLLKLGRAIGAWLDGTQGWLARLLVPTARPPGSVPEPLILEIETSAQPGEIEQAALDAPWELIATPEAGHLALDRRIRLSPVRRLDIPGDARPPSRCRLSVLFMAAQPRDVTVLDFEREESAIVSEVDKLDPELLDLFVEESGTLDGLVAAAQRAAGCTIAGDHRVGGQSRALIAIALSLVALGLVPPGWPVLPFLMLGAIVGAGVLLALRWHATRLASRDDGGAGPVDVIHVSCHGQGGGKSALLLEDEVGDRVQTTADHLDRALAAHIPALTFISACSTAEASAVGRSLAAELCMHRWPAVLGWSGPVDDGDATWLAARLYRGLAQRMSVPEALAPCRLEALEPNRAPRRVWHQARLFLGRAGGGRIEGGTAARRPARANQRQYLDRLGCVPVARDDEFVGRRRALQRVLASLRSDTLVGSVIHGAGQLGKSSLAARVSHRRHDLQTIVIYQDYDAGAILTAIAAQVRRGTKEVIARHRPDDPWDAPTFGGALRELLEGPCRAANHGAILLVVDDFEQVLDPPRAPESYAKVRADLADTIGALIGAFVGAKTKSRLLFTSRHRFIATDAENLDLMRYLWHEPLGAMPLDDLVKRARASLIGGTTSRAIAKRTMRHAAAIELCQGNPGLLQVLLTMIDCSPRSWPAVQAELHAYAERGAPVTQADLAEFMTRVALDHPLAELEPSERELLRLLTAFQTHVPTTVAATLGILAGISEHARGAGAIERMITLGLLDLVLPPWIRPAMGVALRPDEREITVHRLAAPRVLAATRPMLDSEIVRVAGTSLGTLRTAWDAAVHSRALRECSELTRLARIADDAPTLAEVAGAVAISIAETDARKATELVLLVAANEALWPNADEFRLMAYACRIAGHPEIAEQLLRRGLALDDLAPGARARLQMEIASWHMGRGEFDEGLQILTEAAGSFEQLGAVRENAATQQKIANILLIRGELNEALRIQNEALSVYERLGDIYGKVAARGGIADILLMRGELNEALRIQNEEVLPVYDRLGDVGSKAAVQERIAYILKQRGELNEALKMLAEAEGSLDRLGDVSQKAMTQEHMADVLMTRGDHEEALRISMEALRVHERMGDARSKALTQLRIAVILAQRGELDEGLQILKEARGSLQRLGDVRSEAMTWGLIATLLKMRGELDEALRMLRDAADRIERLGDMGLKAMVCAMIADILSTRGEPEEALRMLGEVTGSFEQNGHLAAMVMTRDQIANMLKARGELDEALRIWREQLPIHERLGDVRGKAMTQGKIAGVLEVRGELDEALRILEEAGSSFDRLGDMRGKAMTQEKIADILVARGELDEALRIHVEEALPVYKRLGDLKAIALTQGRIVHLLMARGELDEALRIATEEELPIYERLGDVREQTITRGNIAAILVARGNLDEALQIHKDELSVYERLGDVRAKAMTQANIADILMERGELDEALRLLLEAASSLERLGDVRAQAVAQAKIATVRMLRGDRHEALRLLLEAASSFERLGDVRAQAVIQGNIANILIERGELDEALRLLVEAASWLERLGDVREKALIQEKIAYILMVRGELDEALRLLMEAGDLFERLGAVRDKAVTQGQIADILYARGELGAALRIRAEEELPVYERLGNMQGLGVGLAKYAQMLLAEPTRDRIDEARSCLRRSLAIADRLRLPFPDELRSLLSQLEQGARSLTLDSPAALGTGR